MNVIKALQYLTSADGPHIPIKTISIYCGINYNTMKDYISERYNPPPETRAQSEKGLSELIREIRMEWPI